MSQQNVYGLVIPTNSLRIQLGELERLKIKTDIRLKATAHSQAMLTHTEVKGEIDATYLITSQPTLIFHAREWLKPKKLLHAINQLRIPDVPIQQEQIILPSTYDGKRHATTFALINTHTPMFKKMTAKGKIPYRQLLKVHQDFRYEAKKALPKELFRFLKASLMIMVDVNPGKQEMFNKDFILGLRQPFMHKVCATKALWECTDYEVF